MRDQITVLKHLVAYHYFATDVALVPISPYVFDDRGIYRVVPGDGRSYVLRAFRYEVEADLLGQAPPLAFLERLAFPAPRLQRTIHGATLATHEGWTALMLTFIAGEVMDFSPESLTLLGAYVGALHARSAQAPMPHDSNAALLPESRLTPPRAPLLLPDERIIPDDLRPLYGASLETIQRIRQAAAYLPVTLLHGDCWPRNAIWTPDNALVMVDWDGAGLGPAVLDVGYLLMTCHLGKPDLPTMRPDPTSIAAVARGYCRQRQLIPEELCVLEDAIRYDSARRLLLDEAILTAANDDGNQDIRLRKMIARSAASTEIAALARRAFEMKLSRRG